MTHVIRASKNGMPKYVFRTDVRLQPVSECLTCIDARDLVYRPESPTVEECVHMLLNDDEICLGTSDKREIRQGARVVGYIRIIEAS
jgi:hypothetical protein